MEILETKRLKLRQLTVDDAGFILELLNDPAFLQNIGDRQVRTVSDACRYILEGPVASYEQLGFGLYLVELNDSGTPVGICGFLKREFLPDVDIGFAFLPQFRSKGYAFEAASAAMAYGREVLGLGRITAIVSPHNTSSIKLLQKLGLTFVGMVEWPDDGSELELFVTDG